jgi:signal transduction histidine kinase
MSVESRDEAMAIRIQDDGIGMDSEAISGAFEAFQRFDFRSEFGAPGHGLGLPIAKGLAEHLGGTLVLESEIHVGTTAALTLPSATPREGE